MTVAVGKQVEAIDFQDALRWRSESPQASDCGLNHPQQRRRVDSQHSIDFWPQSEDLPHPDNRVTINPDREIVLSIHET